MSEADELMPNTPLLAIHMVTYNHEKYIAQAIESAVAQQTDFNFKLFIADDKSTDNTSRICLEYQQRYPHLIHYHLNSSNLGGTRNSRNNLNKCFASGAAYTAILEGDDYWTDSRKLQKQVDFLQANPDFSTCFHPVKIVYEESGEEKITNENQAETTSFEDIALNNYIHTVSCVYRNNPFQFPEWFIKIQAGDYVLHLLNAQYGKIGFINEVMAVYRVHKGGVWSSQNLAELYVKWIPIIKECRRHFYPKGEEQFTKQLAKCHQQLCFAYFEANRYKDFRQNFASCIPLVRHIKGRAFFALTIRYLLSNAPVLADLYKKTLTSSKPMLDDST